MLSHDEFQRLTPRELGERLEGYQWRQEREMERLAWLAATLINGIASLKRPVRIVELLGRQSTHRVNDGERKLTPEEVEQGKRELIERLGG